MNLIADRLDPEFEIQFHEEKSQSKPKKKGERERERVTCCGIPTSSLKWIPRLCCWACYLKKQASKALLSPSSNHRPWL